MSSGKDTALIVIGIIGNITSLGLFVSPVPTFYNICKKRTTAHYSGLPYVCILLNCMLWTFYGSSAVANLVFVISINAAGLVLETSYVVIHLMFGSYHSRRNVASLLAVVCIFYTIVVAGVMVAMKDKDQRMYLVGSICIVVGIIMYASPLAAMKEVIKTKSVESMPFWLSFASFWNGLIWMAYGAIKNDKFIYIPNGLGTALTIAQLILWSNLLPERCGKGPGTWSRSITS